MTFQTVNIIDTTLCGVVDPRNKDLQNITFGEIMPLINQNPFSERIRFILGDLGLATRHVLNKHNELKPPNCLGSAFWIAGVSDLNYPYHAYDYELKEHMNKNFGPKYWDSTELNLENAIPGAFVFSCAISLDGADWHSGIYLGQIKDRSIMFEQHCAGGSFGPESLQRYIRPRFYIPKTLRK